MSYNFIYIYCTNSHRKMFLYSFIDMLVEVSIWPSPQGFVLAHVGQGQKSPHKKKAPNKEAHRAKSPTKALWARANPWAFIFHMKNILFFKIYYYLWDRPNEPDKHDNPNRSNDSDLPDDLDKNDDSNGPDDQNGLDDPDRPEYRTNLTTRMAR